jgi:hypothetical protein
MIDTNFDNLKSSLDKKKAARIARDKKRKEDADLYAADLDRKNKIKKENDRNEKMKLVCRNFFQTKCFY